MRSVHIALPGAIVVLVAVAGCGSGRSAARPAATAPSADWPQANADLHSTRAVSGPIDAANVAKLALRWRFRIPIALGDSGAMTANPVVVGDTVYLQDMQSNVYALRRADGTLRWEHRFRAGTPGPNGLAASGGRLYGSTDTTLFALDASNGALRWRRRVLTPKETFVDIAPVVSGGRVYTATVGYTPASLGAIYAVDAASGRILWRRPTIRGRLAHPAEAGGGGSWNPLSVDGSTVYAGTANPVPWGGTVQRPNGGSYAGRVLYTDSLLALNPASGGIRWFDQVTPHDVRDYDLEASPVLASAGGRDLVVGAGKAGRVIAWDRATHQRVWQTPVGRHQHDLGPLPRAATTVCPGLLGGVETNMAVADGRLFVPVVDLCYRENAIGLAAQTFQHTDPETGRGQLVALDLASGRQLWRRQLPSPAFGCATVSSDVVFTTTFDGTLYGFAASDGRQLYETRLRAGVNACPAVSGDLVIVAAGVKVKSRPKPVFEVSAYGLP